MKKYVNILLASAAGILVSGHAHAQEVATSQEATPSGLEEIIVTAQRRSETIQKSSLAISVVSAAQLERQGIGSTQDLSKALPGVQIGMAGSTPQIYVRGVGDPGTTAITNPSVALNVGGVYVARPGAAGGAFFDLERVEILKGPQGTLYGRNASGGAINILPVRPRLGTSAALINIDVGNYDFIGSSGAVNLPLGEDVALRAAYKVQTRDGYLSDGSDDAVNQAVRLQVLFKPSDGLSLLLYGSYFHQGGKGAGYALYDPKGNPAAATPRAPTASFDPWTSVTDPRGAAILATGAPPPIFRAGDGNLLYSNNNFWNFQAELSADLGFATLTVIPSYQRATIDNLIFPALYYQTRGDSGAGAPERSRTYSGEVRLSRDTANLKWVLGAFYYDEFQDQQSTINNGFVQNVSISAEQSTKSAAVFGQATYSITDAFRLIAGLRYTKDKRELAGSRLNNLLPPGQNSGAISGRAEASQVNYKAGAEFDLSPQNMLYATVATGFKGGGNSQAVAAQFLPEKLTAYTVGSRNRFLDNSLQLNFEGFYWKYKNQQIQVISPDDIGVIAALIRNAGEATSYGVEADVQYKIASADTLTFNATYNHTNYDRFVYQAPAALMGVGRTGCPVTPTGTVGPVGPVVAIDCSGRPLQRAPEWAGSVAYEHVFSLGTSGSLLFHGDMQFASVREGNIDYIPNTSLPAYQIFNASLTYSSPDEKLSVTGYVRNIGDEAAYSGVTQSTFTASYVAATIAPPRTYGMTLSYRY